jgi:hypothetical protein
MHPVVLAKALTISRPVLRAGKPPAITGQPAVGQTLTASTGHWQPAAASYAYQMNAIMERWIKACRHELLDRTLIWNQRHVLHTLREYEQFYNVHRPHRGIANARPLHPLPPPITDQAQITELDIR